MSLRHVLSAGLLPCALLASGGNAIAQTREDSAAIARLIVTRAVQDAQRQHKRVRTLAWVSTLRSSRDTAVQNSDRLLELGMDSLLVRAGISPVCPWDLSGPIEPRLQLTLGATQISRTEARADVQLSCRGKERGGYRSDYYYMIARKDGYWVVTHVSLRWET